MINYKKIPLENVINGQWSQKWYKIAQKWYKIARQIFLCVSLQTIQLWIAGGGSMAVAVGVSDMWHVNHDMWHLTHDMWHLIFCWINIYVFMF